MLCGLVNALADLARPKAALALLHDTPRLSAYRLAIHAAVSGESGAARLLPLPPWLLAMIGRGYRPRACWPRRS